MKFQLKNIVKGRKTLLIRRTDIHQGNYCVDVLLNGTKAKKNHTNDQMELFKMLLDYKPDIDEKFMKLFERRKTDDLCELLRSRGLIEE